MNCSNNKKIQILDKGHIQLINHMGSDWTPEETARISTGLEESERTDSQRVVLTRYLMRHKHTSPFEFISATFEVKAPIMVLRQWHRHRMQSYNEESGRYKQLEPDYYLPEENRICTQSKSNHQGTNFSEQSQFSEYYRNIWKVEQDQAEKLYESAINDGLANEIARINMPVSHYSTMRVTANLLNWFRFCQLREDGHAQFEIREYAKAIHTVLSELFPECTKAYEDYWLNSITLSAKERGELKKLLLLTESIDSTNYVNYLEKIVNNNTGDHWTKRERTEFIEKLKAL
jgi:thymidylate synthase (FAD)